MKKVGFIEMEMVTIEDIRDFENELKRNGSRFVSTPSEKGLVETYSLYGEIVGDEYLLDTVETESIHHNEWLKKEYEKMYQCKTRM